MFDIGWSEMAIIAFVALIVIGPKDLPKTMKTVAHWMRKARSLTREFQSGIDDIVREAELEDARKALDATRGGNLKRTLSNAIDPDDEVGKEVRAVEHAAIRQATVESVDAILTGFHEPRASHLAMLETLAGRTHLVRAYDEALRHGYLWHEFGDLHLIL